MKIFRPKTKILQIRHCKNTVDSQNSDPLDLTVSICGPKELEIPIFTLD
jgi:hypothetical protein